MVRVKVIIMVGIRVIKTGYSTLQQQPRRGLGPTIKNPPNRNSQSRVHCDVIGHKLAMMVMRFA